jgi:DNA-binding transcriptional LysR family regulator
MALVCETCIERAIGYCLYSSKRSLWRIVVPKTSYDVMDLKALCCFGVMAKHLSLTQAGIELGISDAAVSQRIKALERYLGTKLYESRGGHVHLTSAGEGAAAMAMELFDQLDDFQQSIADLEAISSISLSAANTVLRHLLPDYIERFFSEWPLAPLLLKSRTSRETLDLVKSNEVDLGIIPSCELPPEIEFHPIVTSEGFLIVPLGHALAQHGEQAVQILLKQDVLSQYRLIVPESIAHDRDRLDAFLDAHHLSYSRALEVGTIETAKHYVARDLGIAVVSGICLTEADKNDLVAIPIPLKYEAATTYGVILRRKKFRSAALQGLLSILLND